MRSHTRHQTRSTAKVWLDAIQLTSQIEDNPSRLFADIVQEWAMRQPAVPALISNADILTYEALASRIARYSRWSRSVGIIDGRAVCLMMDNRAEYIAAWLGITSVGGIVALINPKLVGTSLAHCVNLANAEHIILAAGLLATFEAARGQLARVLRVWTHGGEGESDMDAALEAIDGAPLLSGERGEVTIGDPALLIYTSGTTGLPKAARISHRRVINWAGWFAGLTGASPEDRLYNCLPLCHSVGGVVAPCSMLFAGASVVLADRFSAGRFWADVGRFDCTLFQYIGELCRYLLNAPSSEFEKAHHLRLACGNGLRGDIWEAFQSRFAIPKILEFYAATEGNFSLYNVEGKVGSIGKVPPLLAHRFPAALVKIDEEHGVPLRDDDGLCILCGINEVGEAIGRIGRAADGGGRFEGYTDKGETEKKILRNVFAEGDAWFRTGDLMRKDEQGYFYFIDRIGDTFRWKGENVAASEVNDALRDCPGVLDATTYGVAVPGADGRAGMAAIVVGHNFDLKTLSRHLTRRLPAYAHPVFVRISNTLDTTETFKQKKQSLIREGFNPRCTDDMLYFREPNSTAYCSLNNASFDLIATGKVRL
jgi:fatty-acyl-CoA synthase